MKVRAGKHARRVAGPSREPPLSDRSTTPCRILYCTVTLPYPARLCCSTSRVFTRTFLAPFSSYQKDIGDASARAAPRTHDDCSFVDIRTRALRRSYVGRTPDGFRFFCAPLLPPSHFLVDSALITAIFLRRGSSFLHSRISLLMYVDNVKNHQTRFIS